MRDNIVEILVCSLDISDRQARRIADKITHLYSAGEEAKERAKELYPLKIDPIYCGDKNAKAREAYIKGCQDTRPTVSEGEIKAHLTYFGEYLIEAVDKPLTFVELQAAVDVWLNTNVGKELLNR